MLLPEINQSKTAGAEHAVSMGVVIGWGISSLFKQSLQNFTVEFGIHNLVSRNKFLMHRFLDVTESDYHALDIALNIA